jgi:starch phosphorylase
MAYPLPAFPDRIARLPEIAANMAWSWNREARALFRSIDDHLWVRSRYDPFALFYLAGEGRLEQCAADPHFLARYDHVARALDTLASTDDTWYARNFGDTLAGPIAYFCAEFAVYHTVPIYSGGLGVLAGDHCKAASDLGVPLVGVGMLYRGGLVDQRISADGWQSEADTPLDPHPVPLEQVVAGTANVPAATVEMNGRIVHIAAWRLRTGRVAIYLLDTDLPENDPDDRSLLTTLYPGGPDRRLRQEWLLGVGGVRVLRALGIQPAAWHANEGHAAFMLTERLRECVAAGAAWDDAIHEVRRASTFTTHTPVPAGHDVFRADEVRRCAEATWHSAGGDPARYLALGAHPTDGASFHMTVAAIRLSGNVNGVSRVHGDVTRGIWASLWPERPSTDIPIGHVTNGVHPDTWIAHVIADLIDTVLPGNWTMRVTGPTMWDAIHELDDTALWQAHTQLKTTLFRVVREEARAQFVARTHDPSQLIGSGILLDPTVLTLGFARRFTGYKRASLVFTDLERLLRIVNHRSRPVQIVFAGKAHPADEGGKRMLQEVYRATHDPRFEGRVAFVEDYDLRIGHVLVQGVDAWVNLPRVPLEACGTSGMKAAMNGVPQIGTRDGWWAEGYDGTNGWVVPTPEREDEGHAADAATANALYDLLERDVVPAYYERDAAELPRRWIAMMKDAIRVAGSRFAAHRMLVDYVTTCYAAGTPAASTCRLSGAVRRVPGDSYQG